MNRNIDYIIDEDSAGLRVEQFLRRKRYSGQNLSEIKRMPKSILVNGVHYYMRQELSTGDHLQVRICETKNSEKIPPTNLPLDIIYEDEDLLVLNKPAGMPIHPSLNNYTNSIANALAYYFQSQGKPFIFRCCNRLDRDTTGALILAKNPLSAAILSVQMKKRQILRTYLALVDGLLPDSGTINAPIARMEGSVITREVNFGTGESAITHYERLAAGKEYSLAELHLETGRTHQIRVHMKYIGHPLPGDYLYNPDYRRINRQPLHSYQLEFTHPTTGKVMLFTAPLPIDFISAFYSNPLK